MLIVTHDLPYAAQLCDRAVIVDDGAIVADAPIDELLADAELLAAHRLELPWGFDATSLAAARARVSGGLPTDG